MTAKEGEKNPKNMRLREITEEMTEIKLKEENQEKTNSYFYGRYQELCNEIDSREIYKFKFF